MPFFQRHIHFLGDRIKIFFYDSKKRHQNCIKAVSKLHLNNYVGVCNIDVRQSRIDSHLHLWQPRYRIAFPDSRPHDDFHRNIFLFPFPSFIPDMMEQNFHGLLAHFFHRLDNHVHLRF